MSVSGGGYREDGDDRESDDGSDSFDDLLREVAHAPEMPIERPPSSRRRAADDPLVGATLARFRVLRRLGAGGMGVVYLAEDTRLERRVALKVLGAKGAGDQASKERLLREAKSAAAVRHPNIAAIYDADEAEGVAFIAMEYVDGRTLRSVLRDGPLPIDEARAYALEIARGLACAHGARIIHRDLKPDNVMIGAGKRVTILDFGLAKPLAADEADAPGAAETSATSETNAPRGPGAAHTTEAGRVLGTPAYMSPEQAAGEPVDARTDVFAFGVLLFELLTGKLPFAPRRRDGAARGLEPVASVRDLRPEVPEALASVVDRCLAVRASDRIGDGVELEAALNAADAPPRQQEPAVARSVALAWAAVGLVAIAGASAFAGRSRPAALDHGGLAAASLAPTRTPTAPARPTLRRLTANPADAPIVHAALSPDGETLAFIDKNGLSLQRIRTGASRRLELPKHAAPELVAWFPDGTRIAVSAARGGDDTKDLFVADVGGDASTGAAAGVAPVAPVASIARGAFTGVAIAPDGKHVAVAEDEVVSVLDAEGHAPKRTLATKGSGCYITELAWSPDGKRVAYETLCARALASAAIETVGLDGAGATVVVSDARLLQESPLGGFVWTRDGRIVYALAEWLPAESGSNLWSVPVDGSTGLATAPPTELTSWTSVGANVLSGSASRLAFVRFEMQVDVYVGALSDGGRHLDTPARLTRTDRNERPAAWSRDGRGLFFFSDRNGSYDVFFQQLGDPVARSIAATEGAETFPVLAPPGDDLLYWAFPKVEGAAVVQPALMRMAAAGGAASKVLTARSGSYSQGAGRPRPWEARVRCGRTTCVVAEVEDDALVFRRLDALAGTGTSDAVLRLPRPSAAAFLWDLAPDGAAIAIPEERGPVRIHSLTGGAVESRSVPAECDPIYATFSADGSALFVTAECGSPAFRVYHLPRRGPAGATFLWEASPAWIYETEASPDGRHLAIAVKSIDNDVWLLDGL